jgi:iron complex transport system ATP-binding protein
VGVVSAGEIILEARRATCGYGDVAIAREITVDFRQGEVFCLLGPNGCGKTTLFKTLLGFLKLQKGEILVGGRPLQGLTLREIAREVGYVPQTHTPPFPFPVRTVVAMGRTAHLGLFESPGPADRDRAQELLEDLGIAHLADRSCTEISGGERQIALVARALAQEPRLLLMDEPTSNLDFGNQVRVLDLLSRLSREGLGVVMTTHAPDQALRLADRVALMRSGRILSIGTPDAAVDGPVLSDLYEVPVEVADVVLSGGVVRSSFPLFGAGDRVGSIRERRAAPCF